MLLFVILRSPTVRWTTKNLKSHSFMFQEILHFASLHSEWLYYFSLSFWVRHFWRTKNLKLFFHVLRDSSSPSASQNDNYAFFCHSKEFVERRMTKNLNNNSSMFKRFFISLRSIQNDYIIFPVILSPPFWRTKNLKTILSS